MKAVLVETRHAWKWLAVQIVLDPTMNLKWCTNIVLSYLQMLSKIVSVLNWKI